MNNIFTIYYNWLCRLRLLVEFSLSNSQKWIEWIDRKVERYSRLENTVSQFNIIKIYTVFTHNDMNSIKFP